MNLIKNDFFRVFNELDSVFTNKFKEIVNAPQVDFYKEKNGDLVIEVLSTLNPKDIKVELDNGYIIISGETSKEENKNEDRKYYHKSISKESFIQKFYVGKNVNKDSIEAKMENGLLKVSFKNKEDSEDRIEIKVK